MLRNLVGLLILSILLVSIIAPTTVVAKETLDRQPEVDNEIVGMVFGEKPSYKIIHGSVPGFTVDSVKTGGEEYRSVLVVVKNEYFDVVKSNVYKVRYVIPLPKNNIVLAYVTVSKQQLAKLTTIPGVSKIIPSTPITELLGLDDRKKFMAYEDNGKAKLRNGYGGGGTGYFKSLDVLGVKRAWDTYGVYGDNVIVGVVDTGIDFSSPELGLNTVAREYGYPMTIVCDEHLALTPVNVVVNASGYLNTTNATVPVYSTIYSAFFGIPVYYTVTVNVDYKMNTNITSQSGIYKFGILEWTFIDWMTYYYITVNVPVVLVDTVNPGVYDTAIFDLSTAFYQLSVEMRDLENNTLGYIMWREPDPAWLDYSFEDEPVNTFGVNELIARDFDGDGIYDFSLGIISGYYLDTWGLTDYTWNATDESLSFGFPGQRLGLDPNGRYVAVFTDFHGHGTNVATIIAARGNLDYYGYGGMDYKLYGAAPHVKLAGGTGFLFGDLMMVEYWIAGWNWIYYRGYGLVPVPGYWVGDEYVLSHRADIVSNSWSYVDVVKRLHQFPGYDILSAYFNYIMFGKWYYAAEYGVTFIPDNVTLVFAAGNEGPGYGSVSSPSADPWIITVGASTLFEYYQLYGYPPGYADDIIPFSSRGPSGVGYPKPDVVAIGAFEWAGVRTIEGRGYGVIGYWEDIGPGLTLFSGTSEATPFVSGVLALGLQAFRMRYGYTPSVFELKALLKSSCDDLNYPALSQGSGRVNAYKLVKTILEEDFYAYIREGIQRAFLDAYYYYYEYELNNHPELLDYMFDTSNYAAATPGDTATFTLNIKGYGYAFIDAVTYIAVRNIVLFNGVYDFSTKYFIIPRAVLRGIDYIEIYVLFKNLSYRYPYYNVLPSDYRYMIRVDAFDQYRDNIYRLNTEARSSTTALLTIGNVRSRVKGDILVRLRPYSDKPPTYVKALIYVRLYRAIRFSWIRFPSSIIHVNGAASITGTIRVPRYAKPGLYEYKIRIRTSSKTITIPGTILVPLVFGNNRQYAYLYSAKSRLSYDSYTPIGLVDPWFGDLTESLDWRMIPVLIVDPNIAGLAMYAKWRSGYASSLEVVVAPPGGAVNWWYEVQRFAAYKLTGMNGYVYNPSPYDQVRGRLKLFIPVTWPTPLRDVDVYYHYYSYPGHDYIKSVHYYNTPFSLGLYRIFITYGSYSGRVLFDTVRLIFFPIRAYINIASIGDNAYRVEATFSAPVFYWPFRYANVFAFTDVEANVTDATPVNLTIGYYIHGDGTYEALLNVSGYRLDNVIRFRYGRIYYLTTSFIVNGTSNIDVSLLIPGLVWHTSGIYYYDYYYGTLNISKICYLALPSPTSWLLD